MTGIFHLSSPLLFGFRQTRPAYAVWPTADVAQPIRHPSRPKHVYRPRGSRKPTARGAKPRQAYLNQPAAWAERTSPTKAKRKLRAAATIGATFVGFGMVIGGFALTQANAPAPVFATAPAPYQQPPTMPSATFNDRLQFSVPANLGGAPAATTMPPDQGINPEASRRQTTDPLLRVAQGQPRVLDAAPALGRTPTETQSPTLVAHTSSGPGTTPPALLVRPAASDPFDCIPCSTALPTFDGVTFAIQTSDVTASATQRLLAALALYDVDLRISAISFPRSEVRYYRAQDADDARILAGQYDASLVDLTWIASHDDPARIEIILAASDD